MENEIELEYGAEGELPEGQEGQENNEGRKEEKPKLTLEQQRGILQRKLTKIDKELGVEKPVEKQEQKQEVKSNEPDYAKLAFLEQRGLTNPDDQKMVQDEAERLKMPLTDVLGMDYIKSKLSTAKEQRESESGMPKGKGRGSGKTQQDVDYWLAKGETPDDLELANKVIEARMRKEGNANKFSDELYSG